MSAENKIIKQILLEEDQDLILYYLYKKSKRAPIHSLFKKRKTEGYFKLLILQHLQGDEYLFRKYCRLNKTQFYFVLSLIEKDMQPKKLRTKITTEEKLFITLR